MIGQSSVCKALQYPELCLLKIPTVSDSVELKLECKSPKEKWQSGLKQIKYYTIPLYQREMLL